LRKSREGSPYKYDTDNESGEFTEVANKPFPHPALFKRQKKHQD